MQEVITYFIIAFAIIYTIYQFIKIFLPSKNEGGACGHCSSGCVAKKTEKVVRIAAKAKNQESGL